MGEGGTRDYACTPHESCILHTDETAFEPLHLPFPFFNFFSFQRLNNWREEGNSSSRKVIENLIVAFRRSILFFSFFFFCLSLLPRLFQPFLFEQTRLNLCEVMRMKCFEFNYIGEFYICFFFFRDRSNSRDRILLYDILRFDFSLRDREIVTRCITRE